MSEICVRSTKFVAEKLPQRRYFGAEICGHLLWGGFIKTAIKLGKKE